MYNDLDIGIIGFGPQGRKISNIVYKKFKKKIIIFSSKNDLNKKKYYQTNIIKDLKKCKIIFICSPNSTHYKYLEYFKDSANYIFCEKPPFNEINEYKKLKKFSSICKKKIYFNFNYLFSEQYKILKRKLQTRGVGDLIDVNISIGNGISFKKNLANTWRSNDKSIFTGIVGNLGIHYINLLSNLLGEIKISDIQLNRIGNFKIPDTAIINISSKKKVTSRIFLTYASPYNQNIKATFSNSIIEICNKKVVEYYPRDTFDKNNNYTKPKKKIIYNTKANSIWSSTLNKSVEYFFSHIKRKTFFPIRNFETNINQVKIILTKINEKNKFK